MKTQYINEEKISKLIKPWSPLPIYNHKNIQIREYYSDNINVYAAYVRPHLYAEPTQWMVKITVPKVTVPNSAADYKALQFLDRFDTKELAMEFADKKLAEHGLILMDKQKYLGIL